MGQLLGRPAGGSIGETGRPIVACHSLPVLIGWGYCCQCAYMAGVKDVAVKAAGVLWTHFVQTSQHCEKEEDTPEYRLKSGILASSHHTLLHHFVYSVFIHTNLTYPPLPSSHHPHKNPPSHTQRLTQLHRLELCSRLRQALVVSTHIEEPSLCLQAVVMCYGLLAPLLQRGIATPSIAKILLHCLCVLGEMPDHLLSHSHSSTQAALHHMIATSAFHLNKMLLNLRKTGLFNSLIDNTRGLLLITMPTTPLTPLCLRNPEIALDLSMGSQAPSLASYATASSGLFPGLLVPRTAGQKRKKGKKKTAHLVEQISDEVKSREYKAFEAFITANCNSLAVPPQLDGSDITGQEDPLLLHAVIATMPAVQAHKEVHKFRRRPQYLEYFVHLASAGMEQGQQHLVLEWAHETFTWLARRNEIILTTRPVNVGAKPHTTTKHNKHTLTSSHPPSRSLPTTKTTTTRVSTSHSGKTPSCLEDSRGRKVTQTAKTPPVAKPHPPTKTTPTTCKAVVRHSGGGNSAVTTTGKRSGGGNVGDKGRRSRKGRSSLLNETLTRLLALEGVVVTRDDLILKATSVLQTLLPETWRKHKCRKRIREVSADELPWRAQANIYLAQCYLDQLLNHLQRRRGGTGEEEGRGRGGDECSTEQLEGADTVINRVIPTYPPVTPGYNLERGERLEAINVTPQIHVKTEKISQPTSSPLQRLAETMCCLQRAVVLAGRGRLWVLLQNACRELWNVISCLVTSLHCLGSEVDSGCEGVEAEDISVAAVYGLASKPLYMALESITDLLDAYTTSGHTLPSSPDTAMEPDFVFLRRISHLALHTMYAQEHWEGLVAAGVRLCEGVRVGGSEEGREWVGDLVPVILKAQCKLSERVKEHSSDRRREAVEPAAHLDPGPDGHDIYGQVGEALARVCVPLEPQTVLDNLQIGQPVQDGAMHMLQRCRNLLARYLTKPVCAGTSLRQLSSLDDVDLAPLPPSQLPLIVTSYNEAISQLEGRSADKVLTACAMHELGNVHLHCHNTKLASQWWRQALGCLLDCEAGLTQWREKTGRRRMGSCVAAMLAGTVAVKLSRFTCANKMDTSLEYLLLGATLFKSIPASSLPYSGTDLSFLPHLLTASTTGTARMELFRDPLTCDPATSLDCLRYCAHELVERRYVVEALPVLWLYWHTAHTECRSPTHTLHSLTLQLRALTQLHLFSDALHLLGETLGGCGLPQTSCQQDYPKETHSAVRFSDNLPLNDPVNIKALKLLMTRDLPKHLAGCCGQEAVLHLSVARADLYIALSSTCITLSPPHFLTRSPSVTRPPTHLFSPSPTLIPSETNLLPPPSSSSSSSPPLSSAKPSRATTMSSRRLSSPGHVKIFLAEQAERLLVDSCHSLPTLPASSSLKLRVHILLSLSRLSLSLQHSSTATQLSLAALRAMQEASEGGVGGRLWLECRLCLAKSLVGQERKGGVTSVSGGGVMECVVQCEEGVREAERYRLSELSAEFHFVAALHSLSLSPPNTQAIMTHTQKCLQLLTSLPSPSPPSYLLLRASCSLLLCDTGSRDGHVTSHDAEQIYQKLVDQLRKQVSGVGSPPCSPYHPTRPLLASALLRLSLSLHTDPHEGHEGRDGVVTSARLNEALSVCQEGLDTLESGFHDDQCLMTTLLSHRAQLLWKIPSTQRSEVINELLVAIKNIADTAVDYRKQFTSCFEVAWLLSEAIQLQQVSLSPVLAKRKSSRSSSRVIKTSSPRNKFDEEEGEVRGRVKSLTDVKKESFAAWCALRTARQAHLARESLQRLTSQLYNPDLAKTIPDKAMADMPDCALLELRPGESVLGSLLGSCETLPVDLLVPSLQSVRPAGMTWFHVVSHAYCILVRCFWPHGLPSHTSTSSPPPTHTLTPSLHAKYHALASFLQQHCPTFSTACSLPSLPPSLFPLPTTTTRGATTIGGGLSRPSDCPPHLRAGEGEVTVVWYRPPAHSQLLNEVRARGNVLSTQAMDLEREASRQGAGLENTTTSGDLILKMDDTGSEVERREETSREKVAATAEMPTSNDNIILGLFGFNQKAVRPPQTSSTTITPSVQVFQVCVNSTGLRRLQEVWTDISTAAQEYLDGHVTGRPVSRSPSRLRKQAEKTQKIHAGLQAKLTEAVRLLCTVLGRCVDEKELPRLEPHVLGGVSSLLPPPTLPSSQVAQGDVFYFLHELFHSTQPSHSVHHGQ